jgi:hypothetical protein
VILLRTDIDEIAMLSGALTPHEMWAGPAILVPACGLPPDARPRGVECEAENVKGVALKGREHVDEVLNHGVVLVVRAHEPNPQAVRRHAPPGAGHGEEGLHVRKGREVAPDDASDVHLGLARVELRDFCRGWGLGVGGWGLGVGGWGLGVGG